MTETRKCIVCGKEFKAHKMGRPAAYCSNPCRLKARKLGIKAPTFKATIPKKLVCPVCGKEFKVSWVKGRSYKCYCGRACALAAHKAQRKKDKAKERQRLYAGPRPPAKKRPVTYAEIRRANLQRGNQDGWRGTPVMGGGGVVNMFSPACQ